MNSVFLVFLDIYQLFLAWIIWKIILLVLWLFSLQAKLDFLFLLSNLCNTLKLRFILKERGNGSHRRLIFNQIQFLKLAEVIYVANCGLICFRWPQAKVPWLWRAEIIYVVEAFSMKGFKQQLAGQQSRNLWFTIGYQAFNSHIIRYLFIFSAIFIKTKNITMLKHNRQFK